MEKHYPLNLPVQGKKHPLVPSRLLSAETILRLNPHWIIEELVGGNPTFTAVIKDYESQDTFRLMGALSYSRPRSFILSLENGDYKEISFVQEGENYSASVVYRCEGGGPSEDIERHVILWIRSIKEYLRMYLKNTITTVCFRYIMNRAVLKMTPSQRKISLMLIRIAVIELLVIILIVVGYVFFTSRVFGGSLEML